MTQGEHRPPAVLIIGALAGCLQIDALAWQLPEIISQAKGSFVADYGLQILAVLLLLGAAFIFHWRRIKEYRQSNDQLQARIKRLYSEIDNLKEELNYRSGHDPLTRLPNRNAALSYLASELEKPSGSSLGCIILALDNFKRANDSLGQEKGDEILCRIAAAIKEAVGEGDFVARYGGDEFVIVRPGATSSDLESLARRLAGLSYTEESTPGWKITVTTSVGAVLVATDSRISSGTVLATADALVLEVKREGGRGYRTEQFGDTKTVDR
ncbi:MAG TPA: GGDEF domain-containing protein [Acidobacteriota bacterium]|nr:GGDEF domain-containing protein [Acidobacteriota bacterium]